MNTMDGNCPICNHPNKIDIQEMLIKDSNFEDIIEKYNTKENKLFIVDIAHHRTEHMKLEISPMAIEVSDGDVSANSLGVLLSRLELLHIGLKDIVPSDSKDAFRKAEALIKVYQGQLRVIDVYEKHKRDSGKRNPIKDEKENLITVIKRVKKEHDTN
ncbi:hypothetical protein LCGC14_2103720 [marine sediment metagenome]|uniref:Uncharacterized protein n=1 Tax=marine sediment metagenome TaxID=412755 RepID=A0A0F9E936_9ZZZZ